MLVLFHTLHDCVPLMDGRNRIFTANFVNLVTVSTGVSQHVGPAAQLNAQLNITFDCRSWLFST